MKSVSREVMVCMDVNCPLLALLILVLNLAELGRDLVPPTGAKLMWISGEKTEESGRI